MPGLLGPRLRGDDPPSRSGLTQTAAAERIGIKQPDLSKVLRGNFAGFSLERLLAAANAMGADFEIQFKKARAKRPGRAVVREYSIG